MHKQFFYSAIILGLVYIFTAGPVFSQRGAGQFQEQRREMEARRIAFITTELSLTPDQAAVFWPVYNEYNRKRNEMMIRHRNLRLKLDELDSMSDQELNEIADSDVANMEEMTTLRREYHEKFKTILPVQKVILLYDAERNFNRNLLRDSRGSQRGGRGRN